MTTKVKVTVVCARCEQRWTFRVKNHLTHTCQCGAQLAVSVNTSGRGAHQFISVRTRD